MRIVLIVIVILGLIGAFSYGQEIVLRLKGTPIYACRSELEVLAGYAGTDFLENLYKLRFAQFFKVSYFLVIFSV